MNVTFKVPARELFVLSICHPFNPGAQATSNSIWNRVNVRLDAVSMLLDAIHERKRENFSINHKVRFCVIAHFSFPFSSNTRRKRSECLARDDKLNKLSRVSLLLVLLSRLIPPRTV
jgi:hypothetical protein